MRTNRPPLSYDVFVAPEKRFTTPPPRVGDPPAWDPTTSTLIFGARDSVLVESLMTVRGNPPSVLTESPGYLEYYGQLCEAVLSDRELFDAMMSRHPDWVSRQQFLLLGSG
jgi:hypothetical protein